MPRFKAIAFLGSKLWNINNPILVIQVQECVGEFQVNKYTSEHIIRPILTATRKHQFYSAALLLTLSLLAVNFEDH